MAEGIKLPSASGTQDGLVTAGAQTIGGAKTLNQGVTTLDTSSQNVTVAANTTLKHPFLTIDNGVTYTVAANGHLIVDDTLIVTGTGTLIMNGDSIVTDIVSPIDASSTQRGFVSVGAQVLQGPKSVLSQPSFMIRKTTAQSPSSGANPYVIFDGTPDFNVGGGWGVSSSSTVGGTTFTAPIAGKYLFCVNVMVSLSASGVVLNSNMGLQQAGSVTRTYIIGDFYTGAGTTTTQEFMHTGSIIANMAVGDTMKVGGTLIFNTGTASYSASDYTNFSGYFLG